MDRWLMGLDEGRCGNRGIRPKLKGMAHSHMQNAKKKKRESTAGREEDELSRRLHVWAEWCTMGLLALQ